MSALRKITSQNIRFVYRNILNPKYVASSYTSLHNAHVHIVNQRKPNELLYFRTNICFIHTNKNAEKTIEEPKEEKTSLMKRFKQMYRDYWYVLVPVHFVTSAAWFGGFYYAAKSGVDIVGILQTLGVSDRFVNPLKDSSMGYIAVSYALYKIFTPLRYMVTLGGTTLSINFLRNRGYIKPVPSREKLREMFDEKRENFRGTFQETKIFSPSGFSKRKTDITEDLAQRYKEEIKKVKTQVKSDGN